jgi:thymidylate synthase (FAD)
MTIRRTEQSVTRLASLEEERVLAMMAHVCATPYGRGIYDEDKTKSVIQNCVKNGHMSILEHANITLECKTNIGTYKDFTRHRHCAFTIQSTAFSNLVDAAHGEAEVITCEDLAFPDERALSAVMMAYLATADLKHGRDFLPQCAVSTMIMTTNIREWRYIIGCRGAPNENPLTVELRNKIWTVLNWHYTFFFPMEGTNTRKNPMCIYNTWGPSGVPATF